MQELRSIFRRVLIFALFLLILFPAAQAQATLTSYVSRALFNAAVPSPFVENWDSFSNRDIILDGSTANGITYKYVPDTVVPRVGVNFQVLNSFVDSTDPNSLGLTGNPLLFYLRWHPVCFFNPYPSLWH